MPSVVFILFAAVSGTIWPILRIKIESLVYCRQTALDGLLM